MLRKLMVLIILSMNTTIFAKEVTLKHNSLTLNGNFIKIENWQEKPVLLITHGAEHSFRDLYSEEIMELSVDLINTIT